MAIWSLELAQEGSQVTGRDLRAEDNLFSGSVRVGHQKLLFVLIGHGSQVGDPLAIGRESHIAPDIRGRSSWRAAQRRHGVDIENRFAGPEWE